MIYAINRIAVGKSIFYALELDDFLLFPVLRLPRSFPLDLDDVMLGKVPPKSTWQVLNHDLVIASIYVFHQHSELYPKNLYLLVADKLFTTVDGMLLFFEKEYNIFREMHFSKTPAQHEAELESVRHEIRTAPNLNVRQQKELELERLVLEYYTYQEREKMDYNQRQKQYIERLKPPCKIAPLPPRPRNWAPRPKSPQILIRPTPPPSQSDLAYLQRCYEVHGTPKVVPLPRTSMMQVPPQYPGVDATPRSVFRRAASTARRREYVRAARRRMDSPSRPGSSNFNPEGN